jgi:creatinine amidohydrolase/Fe(II)-dependent formamide hydrolase-like protein
MGNWQIPPAGGHMESPNGIYLQTMNMTQVNERLKPLGEDTFLVTRMAEQVAQKMGCTIAEPIWYGSHPYNHMGMPGTIVVPEETLLANMRAIITGLWNMGFRKQIFVNGHGQEEVLPLALHQWAKKYQVPAILISLHTWTVIYKHMKDKAHGGPFDTPFSHADEAECSYSLALFPEFCDMKLAVDNKPEGFLPPGHVDKGGEVYHAPIKGHEHIGLGGIEVSCYPEGVIGHPTLASAEKAKAGLNDLMDYMCKLIGDIMTKFPAGVLPPTDKVCMRDQKEIDELLKGPLNGGKSIYSISYPP